jgi:hypothetical protein
MTVMVCELRDVTPQLWVWRLEHPGRIRGAYDGRGRNETPLWLPEQRALVFADALTERNGELRVWGGRPGRRSASPCAASFARVAVRARDRLARRAVHDHAAFDRALELPPWSG